MKKRLLISNIVVITIAILLVFGLGIIVTNNNNIEQAKQKVVQLTDIYVKTFDIKGDYNESTDSDIRLTVIDKNGKVIADSEVSDLGSLDNHLNREEVIAAVNDEPKVVTRSSSSTGREQIYYAKKIMLSDDDFVIFRVAILSDSVKQYLVKSLPLMVSVLIGTFAVTIIISYFISEKSLKPYQQVKENLTAINNGNYQRNFRIDKDQDINSMLIEIDDLSKKIDVNIKNLRAERNKFDYVLNGINDGVIAVDKQEKIILINQRAKEIFGLSENCEGLNYNAITDNRMLIEAIGSCLKNSEGQILEIKYNDRIYLVIVKTLNENWEDNGLGETAAVILTDISASKKNAEMRSEFFDNAGHELKTPLTAIKGFNELLNMKTEDEQSKKYIAQIAKEVDRMLLLINDMLNLSDLENKKELEKERIDLCKAAEEVVSDLLPMTDEKNVTITVGGEGFVAAEPKHIYELIKNLVENSVKYNDIGGSVRVNISSASENVVLEVADNGIGIAAEHQQRIFERFYRVEKSRSRKAGGTGLGLSIVKHICLLYNAELALESKPGIGTKITVVFPKES